MRIQNTSGNLGYTLVEAMVAISLLMLAVAAAASLSMTIVRQE
ncbi:MAG: prepilin-type N-terminal cleavage/methylation domain-containing protein, partial [Verrucomicrobiales bacterium]